jgi:hypothetical protein
MPVWSRIKRTFGEPSERVVFITKLVLLWNVPLIKLPTYEALHQYGVVLFQATIWRSESPPMEKLLLDGSLGPFQATRRLATSVEVNKKLTLGTMMSVGVMEALPYVIVIWKPDNKVPRFKQDSSSFIASGGDVVCCRPEGLACGI